MKKVVGWALMLTAYCVMLTVLGNHGVSLWERIALGLLFVVYSTGSHLADKEKTD